jgi:hypothetical protein
VLCPPGASTEGRLEEEAVGFRVRAVGETGRTGEERPRFQGVAAQVTGVEDRSPQSSQGDLTLGTGTVDMWLGHPGRLQGGGGLVC